MTCKFQKYKLSASFCLILKLHKHLNYNSLNNDSQFIKLKTKYN